MAGKLNYTGSTKQAREGITLLPKTTFPDTEQPLLFLLQKRGVLPLWAAGQLVDRLIERTGRMPLPAGPEQVFLSPLGTDIRILPGVRSGQGAYLPPETRLSPERLTDGPEAVYRLCALLFHLLSGRILSVESLRARRADLRSGLLGGGLEMGAETALLALLDQGLRLEPSRRFPDPGALRTAMGEVQTILNQAAQARLCLEGEEGQFAGARFTLHTSFQIGRQPGACQILFSPHTPGVSRLHCRVELAWGAALVTDLDSRYGTFLGETRLIPGIPVAWEPGQLLALGSERQAFSLEIIQ